MLVLTRAADQSIKIGPDIVVTVVRVGSRTVRLGIEAPPGVVVLREELACAEVRGQKSEVRTRKRSSSSTSDLRPLTSGPDLRPLTSGQEVEHGAG